MYDSFSESAARSMKTVLTLDRSIFRRQSAYRGLIDLLKILSKFS